MTVNRSRDRGGPGVQVEAKEGGAGNGTITRGGSLSRGEVGHRRGGAG